MSILKDLRWVEGEEERREREGRTRGRKERRVLSGRVDVARSLDKLPTSNPTSNDAIGSFAIALEAGMKLDLAVVWRRQDGTDA